MVCGSPVRSPKVRKSQFLTGVYNVVRRAIDPSFLAANFYVGCRLNIRKSTLFVNGNLNVPVSIPPFALLKPNAILLPSAAPYRSSPQPSSSSLG